MEILFVADIFGLTPEFKKLCLQLADKHQATSQDKLYLISPYDDTVLFTNETKAYQYFCEQGGVASYTEKLAGILSEIRKPCTLIGFSAGGSALWSLVSQPQFSHHQQLLCFYSSQIRHMTLLNPQIPTRLIFPKNEQHFSVDELIDNLQHKAHVIVEQAPFLHGFMNKRSNNYSQQAYDIYLKKLNGWLE